jgi:superoxide dismutase, Fe-Mn family
MPQYSLPDLDYDYGALEPTISGRIMELHHSKHHQSYVDGANQTIEQLDDAREHDDFTRISALEKALAFNISGHVLHSIFWQNLSPNGGGEPEGELRQAIIRDFGSFDAFKQQLGGAASSIMGSGWAALVWEPLGGRLMTTQIYDHQSNTNQGSVPVLVVDAWEHAYYLQYENRKAEFFDAIWDVLNWRDVARRYGMAKQAAIPMPGIHRAQRNLRPS